MSSRNEHLPKDAQALPIVPHGATRIDTDHPWVWIHIGGQWHKGAIHYWYRDGGRLLAWVQHEHANMLVEPWSKWGCYVYDSATIKPRHDDRPPPG